MRTACDETEKTCVDESRVIELRLNEMNWKKEMNDLRTERLKKVQH